MVAHDLAVVRYVSDRVIVMYLGTIVEIGPADALYARPLHPYTRALLSAAPRLHGDKRVAREVLRGELPSPINPPSGCVFRTRCPIAEMRCAEIVPPLRDVGEGRKLACVVVEGSVPGNTP